MRHNLALMMFDPQTDSDECRLEAAVLDFAQDGGVRVENLHCSLGSGPRYQILYMIFS